MSNRKLSRLKIKPVTLCRLEKLKIVTCKDIIIKNKYELMRNVGISVFEADDILNHVFRACAPAPKSCLSMLSKSKESGYLATDIEALDHVLHGGLSAGTITEIAGPSGCGKTQLCTQLSLIAATNGYTSSGSVLYIDTEAAFSAERLLEMAEHRFPEVYCDPVRLYDLGSRVHVYLESTCDSLLQRLKNLEAEIIENKARLVIVDSIASLIRKEFDSSSGQNMIERTNLLVKQAALLKYIAQTFNIPVVVTNQITTRYARKTSNQSGHDGSDVTLDSDATYVTAALGNTWSHCVNTRLIVQYLDGAQRQILVAKSPIAPCSMFVYTIEAAGIIQQEGGADHYDGTDPGLQKIRVRSSIEQDAFTY